MTTSTEQAREDALKCAAKLQKVFARQFFDAPQIPTVAEEIITRELALEELYACVEALRVMNLHADCSWAENKGGHDWADFVIRASNAISALDAKKGAAK